VQWFVTVDDLRASFQASSNTDAVFDALDRAFRTASWLHEEAELDFVVAPLRDDDGIVIHRLSDRYAVTVSRTEDTAKSWKVLSANLSG
jgi:hypothetical protein